MSETNLIASVIFCNARFKDKKYLKFFYCMLISKRPEHHAGAAFTFSFGEDIEIERLQRAILYTHSNMTLTNALLFLSQCLHLIQFV